MPTYEYRCAEGHITEAFQKMTDPPLKRCGTCGKKVERVLFAPSIHYKGSGFYSTDHGKGKKAKDGKAEGGATSEKKKDAGGGDAKKASSSSSSSSSS
ncbi:MAG: FmdB family zinc ribbon protein [Actinomycetota bacterium]